MKDGTIVDNMLKGANQKMVNKMTADFLAALGTKNASQQELVSGVTFAKDGSLSYDVIVDAISELNQEDESKIFIIIPNKWKAALRKDSDYKSAQLGQVIYNGQVGTICGIPVIATKALTDKAYVMTAEAVKLFMKKDVNVEQDRDVDKRKNSVYLRMTYVVALVDSTKVCKITEAAS
nr:MAG TPA: major capsid protein [Caudoviricetes sp.]